MVRRFAAGDTYFGLVETRGCESCGKPVYLNRQGEYRRHFTVAPDGRRHLCVASGRTPAGFVRLLAVEPTAAERDADALRLFGT